MEEKKQEPVLNPELDTEKTDAAEIEGAEAEAADTDNTEEVSETKDSEADSKPAWMRNIPENDEARDPDLDMHVSDLDRPDPVKKDFKSRFFRVSDAFGDFFFLNLMFSLGCIPIITIGTSFAALHTVMQKRIRNEDGKITKDFWNAYKANLRQGILVWVIVLVYVAVALFGIWFSFHFTGFISTFIICADGVLLITMLFMLPFLFPLIARYENTTFNVFRNALILALSEFPTWFQMVLPWAAVIVVYLFFPMLFLMTWFLWIMILVSIIVYAQALLMKKVFDKIEAKQPQT